MDKYIVELEYLNKRKLEEKDKKIKDLEIKLEKYESSVQKIISPQKKPMTSDEIIEHLIHIYC